MVVVYGGHGVVGEEEGWWAGDRQNLSTSHERFVEIKTCSSRRYEGFKPKNGDSPQTRAAKFFPKNLDHGSCRRLLNVQALKKGVIFRPWICLTNKF